MDGRQVAIKWLKPDAVGPCDREIEIAEYFLGQNHPHVIGILDVGRDKISGDLFLVMERAQQSIVALPMHHAATQRIVRSIAKFSLM